MDGTPVLTEQQWRILDSLADGEQTFEQVFGDYAASWPSTTPKDMLPDLFYLYDNNLVAIRQRDSESDLPSFEILPSTPEEITRDVQAQFDEFSARYAEGSLPAEPMGLWLETTLKGESEWGSERYKPYWRESPAPPAKEKAAPAWLPYAIAGFILVLMAIAIWGFTQGTWSMAADRQVNLGPCLIPMRATLEAAGAPAEALQELDMAGRPNDWQSDALLRLTNVDKALEAMPPTDALTAVRTELGALLEACRPDVHRCGCSSVR